MTRSDHCTPGCEDCERGWQCDRCDAEDRRGSARCQPTWVRRRDLMAAHDAHVTTGVCRASDLAVDLL